jgi:hypothetical protein
MVLQNVGTHLQVILHHIQDTYNIYVQIDNSEEKIGQNYFLIDYCLGIIISLLLHPSQL